jgi:hypothetical protein
LAKQKFNGRGWEKRNPRLQEIYWQRKEPAAAWRYNCQNGCKGRKTGRYETIYEMASPVAG